MDERTLSRLKTVIADQLDVEIEHVVESASFADDLGADSLDLVDLVLTLEELFEIQLPDGQAEMIRTVADAIAFIDRK
jgi:acyl carrier protein